MLEFLFTFKEDNSRVDTLFNDSTHAVALLACHAAFPYLFITCFCFYCQMTAARIEQSLFEWLTGPIDSVIKQVLMFENPLFDIFQCQTFYILLLQIVILNFLCNF